MWRAFPLLCSERHHELLLKNSCLPSSFWQLVWDIMGRRGISRDYDRLLCMVGNQPQRDIKGLCFLFTLQLRVVSGADVFRPAEPCELGLALGVRSWPRPQVLWSAETLPLVCDALVIRVSGSHLVNMESEGAERPDFHGNPQNKYNITQITLQLAFFSCSDLVAFSCFSAPDLYKKHRLCPLSPILWFQGH